MKLRFRGGLLCAAAAAVLACSADTAKASISTNFINSLGGHLEHHNDGSAEYLINRVGADPDVLDVGDSLAGIFIIESIGLNSGNVGTTRLSSNGSNGFELTGVFQTVVVSKTAIVDINPVSPGNQGGWLYGFAPDPAFEALYGSGAMAAMFEDTTPDYNPLAATLAAAIGTANDGALQAALGYAGLAGEGWVAITTTDDIGALPGGVTQFGNSYTASLNLVGGSGDYLTDLAIPFAQLSQIDGVNYTQFSISGQFFGNGSNANFPIGDSTDIFFQVAVIPEPMSLLTWAGLAAAGAVCVYRRKR